MWFYPARCSPETRLPRSGMISSVSGGVTMTPMPRTAAAIYCRISLDAEGRGLGVQRQEFECRELAQRLGLDVRAVFVDNDISAYKDKHRPAWSDMTARIRAGEFQALIAWHPDRLTRHPLQLEALVELLEQTHTRVATVTAGEFDLGTATGRMVARVVGAVARHESERTSERLRAGFRQKALAGEAHPGGRRPYGFERDGAHRPDEAEAIRRAAKQILAGRPIVEVARGMPPSPHSGKPWPTPSLKRVLAAPRLVGLRTYRGELVAVANWRPILERGTWEALGVVLADKTLTRTPKRAYLLSGIVVDSRGVPAHGATREGVRYYATSRDAEGRRGLTINADGLEAIVLKAAWRLEPGLMTVREWDGLTLTQRRAVIADAFESVVLMPLYNDNGRRRSLNKRVVITPRAP
jgi:DNA invertase Pin-like site-specific DNA recombinase